MLHQSPDTQSPCRSPGVHGCLQVPDLDLPIIGSTHNPLAIESDAADELLMALQDPETGAALDVPQPDGVVRAAADDQSVVVLEAGDASLVTIQSPHKLAGAGRPDLQTDQIKNLQNLCQERLKVAHEEKFNVGVKSIMQKYSEIF